MSELSTVCCALNATRSLTGSVGGHDAFNHTPIRPAWYDRRRVFLGLRLVGSRANRRGARDVLGYVV